MNIVAILTGTFNSIAKTRMAYGRPRETGSYILTYVLRQFILYMNNLYTTLLQDWHALKEGEQIEDKGMQNLSILGITF